jgi:ribonuclease III
LAVGRIRQAGGDKKVAAREHWAATRLHYSFTDSSLLETALTHRSASGRNNERLEFLGDAFLSLFIARRLYELNPHADEGDLSRLRAALVRRDTLAELARELDVDSHLILGPGELRSGGAGREAAQADSMEALIGAVLLDGGHDAAEQLLERLYGQRLEELPDSASLKDPRQDCRSGCRHGR